MVSHSVTYINVPTMVSNSVTYMNVPTMVSHSVTYMNVPTMVPTQSPTRMHRFWYPLSYLHECTHYGYPLSHLHECTDYVAHSATYTNVPILVPTQSPTRHISYRAYSVSPRVCLLVVTPCLLNKVPALKTIHFPIKYAGSAACSFSCAVYRPWGTHSLFYNVPAWVHLASHII